MAGVGYGNVVLDEGEQSVHLVHPGTRIGFGAMGKGYAANRAAAVLCGHGIASGVVNAGGDLLAFGQLRVIGVADLRYPDRILAKASDQH